jgi:hypothetical protein
LLSKVQDNEESLIFKASYIISPLSTKSEAKTAMGTVITFLEHDKLELPKLKGTSAYTCKSKLS